MKFRVKSFLTLRKAMDGQASLEIGAELTIRQLLEKLCNRFGENLRSMIFDPEAQWQSQDIKILINGRHYRHMPNLLDSELKDGNEVCIFPLMAGGQEKRPGCEYGHKPRFRIKNQSNPINMLSYDSEN